MLNGHCAKKNDTTAHKRRCFSSEMELPSTCLACARSDKVLGADDVREAKRDKQARHFCKEPKAEPGNANEECNGAKQ